MTPACQHCGRRWFRGNHDACQRRIDRAGDIAWFQRTGHCGQCGQPGGWCQCPDTKRDRCGCHELHPVGSGIGRDPAAVFADQPPAEQGTLL